MKRRRLTKNQRDEAMLELHPLGYQPCVHVGIRFAELTPVVSMETAAEVIRETDPSMTWFSFVHLSTAVDFTSISVDPTRDWSHGNPIHDVVRLATMLRTLYPGSKVWGGWHDRHPHRSPCVMCPTPDMTKASMRRMELKAVQLRRSVHRTVEQVVTQALPLFVDGRTAELDRGDPS